MLLAMVATIVMAVAEVVLPAAQLYANWKLRSDA